jgi:hypothetical protein
MITSKGVKMVEKHLKNSLESDLAITIDRWYFSIKDRSRDKNIGMKKELLKGEIAELIQGM